MRLSTSMMYANGLKGVLSQETDMNRRSSRSAAVASS